MELAEVVEPESSPPELSVSDRRALTGIVMAWTALVLSTLGWLCCLAFVGAFRNEYLIGLWLTAASGVLSLAGCILSWLARRRVRDASSLHASLDFISTFAWHVSWTAFLVTLFGAALVYNASQALQEETLL